MSAVAPSASEATGKRLRWGVVAMLMALCLISHMNRISMSVAADERIMKQYGIAPDEMGMVYSAFLLVYTLFMIRGGFFIDRFGSRTALAVVGFGSAVFCLLTGAVGWLKASIVWRALLLVRGYMGLITTPLHPAAAKSVGLWVPDSKRNLVNGMITGAALLGIACTYPFFGWLIVKFDWPRAFIIMGAITGVLGLVWLAVAPRRHEAEGQAMTGWKVLLRNRNVWVLTLSYAAIGYFQYLFFYWMHYYFVDVLHLGKEASRYYAGLPPLTMAICMPIGGWLSDRLRPNRALVPICGMVAGALLLGCGVFAKTPFWIVFWFSLALGAVGAAEAAFWSTIVEVGQPYGGAAAAIMNTGGNGGGMLAPYLTPLVSKAFGWPVGIALGGLVCLAGAMCWIGISRREHEFQVSHGANAR